jgi:hypothetical protein
MVLGVEAASTATEAADPLCYRQPTTGSLACTLPRGEVEMRSRGWKLECGKYLILVQRAGEILIRERAFCADQAACCLYELAQARELLVAQVARRVLLSEWIWTEASLTATPSGADR